MPALSTSMLPAHLHIQVAKRLYHVQEAFGYSLIREWCYAKLDAQAKANNLIFMNKIGSGELITWGAMKWLMKLRRKAAKWFSFESFCGGL
jgi:hypothetical protein